MQVVPKSSGFDHVLKGQKEFLQNVTRCPWIKVLQIVLSIFVIVSRLVNWWQMVFFFWIYICKQLIWAMAKRVWEIVPWEWEWTLTFFIHSFWKSPNESLKNYLEIVFIFMDYDLWWCIRIEHLIYLISISLDCKNIY